MQEWIIDFMNQFGYFGIALLIAIENIFPPIPSELILTFGGFMTTYTGMTDDEDALAAQCAKRVKADCIVTRDISDYASSPVPAKEPAAFPEQFK